MKNTVYSIQKTQISQYKMPAIESNMYLLTEEHEALIVDPNINEQALTQLREEKVQRLTVLLTHEHFDHISGINWLRQFFEVEVICSAACAQNLSDSSRNMAKFWDVLIMDKPEEAKVAGEAVKDVEYVCCADKIFESEFSIDWQGHSLRLKSAPGHSKGGALIWLDEKILFSGDNLVNGTGVICRFPGGSKKEYAAVTRPILESLPDDLFVCPGHGEPGPLGQLRQYTDLFNACTDRRVPAEG